VGARPPAVSPHSQHCRREGDPLVGGLFVRVWENGMRDVGFFLALCRHCEHYTSRGLMKHLTGAQLAAEIGCPAEVRVRSRGLGVGVCA
jgi:hypothetical protein